MGLLRLYQGIVKALVVWLAGAQLLQWCACVVCMIHVYESRVTCMSHESCLLKNTSVSQALGSLLLWFGWLALNVAHTLGASHNGLSPRDQQVVVRLRDTETLRHRQRERQRERERERL